MVSKISGFRESIEEYLDAVEFIRPILNQLNTLNNDQASVIDRANAYNSLITDQTTASAFISNSPAAKSWLSQEIDDSKTMMQNTIIDKINFKGNPATLLNVAENINSTSNDFTISEHFDSIDKVSSKGSIAGISNSTIYSIIEHAYIGDINHPYDDSDGKLSFDTDYKQDSGLVVNVHANTKACYSTSFDAEVKGNVSNWGSLLVVKK